jgi:dolichol-phosphate mannosyltransferase
MPAKTLIFIPTYNERDNAQHMCAEIHALGIDADVLFVDDNSPDGTGTLLEALQMHYPRLIVHHRSGKLGIGSAHFESIQWAYNNEYQIMITLDCDFTHSPSDIPAMLAALGESEVAVGSRWLKSGSLPGWNPVRRFMTGAGHLLTKTMLGMTYDASGAFRAYRLDKLPREVFELVRSRGYSFFFESLFILMRNGFDICEVPIVLPARTYGHSKMSALAALKSLRYVFLLSMWNFRRPEQFLLEPKQPEIDAALVDPQHWDTYWSRPKDTGNAVYEIIAGIYRRTFIKRNLDRAIRANFAPNSTLLHAGCGSGQVDVDLQNTMCITAVDISPDALRLYARNNQKAALIKHASIFELPFESSSFDGIYNLGVMEHFSADDISRILTEFSRVLKPTGKLVLFWPHKWASSVLLLRFVHRILHGVLNFKTNLHPPEITHLAGKKAADQILRQSGFELSSYDFGPSDLFVQAVITGQK